MIPIDFCSWPTLSIILETLNETCMEKAVYTQMSEFAQTQRLVPYDLGDVDIIRCVVKSEGRKVSSLISRFRRRKFEYKPSSF